MIPTLNDMKFEQRKTSKGVEMFGRVGGSILIYFFSPKWSRTWDFISLGRHRFVPWLATNFPDADFEFEDDFGGTISFSEHDAAKLRMIASPCS